MASGIEKDRFDDLLEELNEDYSSSKKYNWLRCLLHDNLTIEQRSTHKSAIHLFKELCEGVGCRISYIDVEILAEIAELTGQQDALTRINEYITAVGSKYTSNRGPKLTPYRRALFQSLRQVASSELPNLMAFYQLYDQASVWDLVFNLENEQRLKARRFARHLNATARSILLDSLTQSTVTGGPPATILADPKGDSLPQPAVPGRPPGTEEGGLPTIDAKRPLPVSTTELSQEDYQQLLVDVSSWWQQHGSADMLKVLLGEFPQIAITQIEEKDQSYDLFQLLLGSGLISRYNVDVLIEATALAGLNGVEEKITKLLPSFPGFNQIVFHRFSQHRINLMEFGRNMTTKKKNKIGHLYGFKGTQLANPWVLLFELETNEILTEETKESFIKKLEENEMEKEAAILKNLVV